MVAAALVDDLDRPSRLLAARRSTPAELAGGWELPGGKVEPGEAPADALHRELQEELGIRVRVGAELVGPDAGTWPISAALRMRVWLAAITEGVPDPDGSHDLVTWLQRQSWLDVDWLPADLPVVRALLG